MDFKTFFKGEKDASWIVAESWSLVAKMNFLKVKKTLQVKDRVLGI
jgi:hypothetical protein